LKDGRADPHVVSQSQEALIGPRPILDSFGPHEPWDPTPSEWEMITLEVLSRTEDVMWLSLAMGFGFEFDGDPQDLRARRSSIHADTEE
jgi:hypothetical protein